jgi:hypothetical protein
MIPADEHAVSYINTLPDALRPYAVRFWEYLREGGTQPNFLDFPLSFAAGQSVRIKLQTFV